MTDDAPLENITKAPPVRRGRPPLNRPASIMPPPNPTAVAEDSEEPGYQLYASVPKPTMRAMELKRHYKPMELPDPDHPGEFLPPTFEIVGYNQPEITRKGPDGRPFIVQEAAFIPGVMAPSPMPGVDVKGKIWATTVIRVPVEEARHIRVNGIGDATVED